MLESAARGWAGDVLGAKENSRSWSGFGLVFAVSGFGAVGIQERSSLLRGFFELH